jgi:hypothetical protein
MIRRTLLLVALIAVGACGHKTRPLAPEQVLPEAPSEIVAASMDDGVRLTWKRPDRYTGGKQMNDLGGFVIERAAGEGTPPAFARVGDVQLDDRGRFRKERRISWTDTSAVPGETYVYRVTAVTTDDYTSAPGGPITIRYQRKVAR